MTYILKDESFLQQATELIQQAQTSIYISTFKAEITTKRRGAKLKQFFDLLIQAALENVEVRLITNGGEHRGHIPDSNIYALRMLKFTKVKVRILPNSRVCHSKIILIDNKLAILGSHNLSVKSCHNNFEISCIISEPVALETLHSIYEEVWSTGKDI